MAAYIQDCIFLFGDSITQGAWEEGGFGQRLSHVYSRKLDVLNRGLAGYNTEWAIPVFEQSFASQAARHHAPKARLLVIWFGANDSCIEPSPQHVPVSRFADNMKHFIDLVRSPASSHHSPETRMILVTPPPVNTHQRAAVLASRNPPMKLDRLFDTTRVYAEAVKEVAAREKVALLDVWTSFWNASGKEEKVLSKFLSDGLHLTHEGYQIVFEGLMETIEKEYPELHYDRLRYVFPPWAEIDPSNLRQSVRQRDAMAETN